MIDIIPIEAQNVIGIKIAGKIEKADMEKVTQLMKEKLIIFEKLRIYVELEAFGGLSFEALVQDIKFGFSHFKEFEKKAIVSDKTWVVKLAALGDKLIPSIEVRRFSFNEKAEALDWIQA